LVRDNGSGIPPDLLGRLFIPFVKREGGGSGTGLAIVEKIVKIYNGSIRAYNDNGACFEFVLHDYQRSSIPDSEQEHN
jgi:signal transduction histidine kinase